MATQVNQENQGYFLRIAPDLSIFELAEAHYYAENLSSEYFSGVFSYSADAGSRTSYSSEFRRAMFKVYSSGNLSVQDMDDDEYCVVDYRDGIQIVVAISDAPITIECDGGTIDLVVGVAF